MMMIGFTREDLEKIERIITYSCTVQILPSTHMDFLDVRASFKNKDLHCQYSYNVYELNCSLKEQFIERFAFAAKKAYEEKE